MKDAAIESNLQAGLKDMNSHMICKANRDLGLQRSKPAHSLLNRISHIFVHADSLQETTKWYEDSRMVTD
ncbi:hypothetical protein FHS14_006501 [Paenibacillus baekrokdamisoli]|uniref:hypothetical protein n=1 Tax=Paenibacillus baekrokdamisoli TaxID=1712516 RepID=UPI000F76EF9F|nr:hypothetical protein [Paenibacillus baekrokdamisoli]MBB3073443.1 hypothetical protein [Paenibacillus baekrokdamisoli]